METLSYAMMELGLGLGLFVKGLMCQWFLGEIVLKKSPGQLDLIALGIFFVVFYLIFLNVGRFVMNSRFAKRFYFYGVAFTLVVPNGFIFLSVALTLDLLNVSIFMSCVHSDLPNVAHFVAETRKQG